MLTVGNWHPKGGIINRKSFTYKEKSRQNFRQNIKYVKAQNGIEKNANRSNEKNQDDDVQIQLLELVDNQLKFMNKFNIDKVYEKLQDIHQSQYQTDLHIMNKLECSIMVTENLIKQSTENSKNMAIQFQELKTQMTDLLNRDSQASYTNQEQIIQDLRHELQAQKKEGKNQLKKQEQSDEYIQDLRKELQNQKKQIKNLQEMDENTKVLFSEIPEQQQMIESFLERQYLLDKNKVSKYNLEDLYEIKFREVKSTDPFKVTFDIVSDYFMDLTIELPKDKFRLPFLCSQKKGAWDFQWTHPAKYEAVLEVLHLLNYKIVKAIIDEQDLKDNIIELEMQSPEGELYIFRGKAAHVLTLVLWRDDKPIYITKSSAKNLCNK